MMRLIFIVDGLRRAARDDPGKAAVLVLLIVVMVTLWVKVLGGGSQGPGSARAQGVTRATGESEGMGLSGGAGLRIGQSEMHHQGLIQEWLQAPVRPMERNLFAVRLDYFPTDGSRPLLANVEPEGFWEQLEKSTAAQADQRRERQILVENLRRQAAQLKLQTIVMGETPKAMINGEPVGEGEIVASFRVIRIDARRVVIEREGIRLELQMK